MEKLVFILIATAVVFAAAHEIIAKKNIRLKRGYDPAWGYRDNYIWKKGPSEWGILFPQCSTGKEQSPINYEDKDTSETNVPLQEFLSLSGSPLHGTLQNSFGHCARFIVDQTKGSWTAVNEKSHYDLSEFHFHFGCDGSKGSEHKINGENYAGEVHLAFYNRKYVNLINALGKPDGILQIALFLKDDCPKSSEGLKCLVDQLPRILHQGSSAYISCPVAMRNMIPQYFKKDQGYFTYNGSLTSPPCTENVKWVVLKEPLCLPSQSIDSFRSLLSTHGGAEGKMCDNFRPVQPLNGRTVLSF